MSFNDLDRRRVSWCLVVNGLAYRYCSVIGPGSSVTDGRLFVAGGATAQSPVDVVGAVIDVGPIEGHIDDLDPVASQSPVEVKILARGARTAAGTRINPLETLMRVAGHSASTYSLKLIQGGVAGAALPHSVGVTAGGPVYVARDPASFAIPGPIHCGHEVMWATGIAGAGTTISPYRFTGVTRGADKWATQEHVVDADRGEQPWVTSDVTTWRGRRAAIYVSALDQFGVAIGWNQYWQGLIDSPPTFDGTYVTVRIAPLSAVMGYRIGVGSAARQATSVAGIHQFRVGTCDRLDMFTSVKFGGMNFRASAADNVAGTITLDTDSAAFLDLIGDASTLRYTANNAVPVAGTYATPVLTFGVSAIVAAAVAQIAAIGWAQIVVSGEYRQSFPLRIVDPAGAADQVVAWPSRLQTVINTANAYNAPPVASWEDPSAGAGQPRLAHSKLVRGNDTWALLSTISIAPYGDPQSFAGKLVIERRWNTIRAGWPIEVDDVANVRRYPFARLDVSTPLEAVASNGDPPDAMVHEGPSVWFYQNAEPYIGPWDADIYSGGTQQIEIIGSGDPVRMWISGSTSAVVDGVTRYWYTVHQPRRAPNVLQMESDNPLSVYVVAAASDSDPPTYIARLLASGTGNGDNGSVDVMPIGANLPAGAIELATFTDTSTPDPLIGQDYEAVRGKSIKDQTAGLLLACGSQIAQVYDSTEDRWRVAMVHMGPADSSLSVLTIVDADLLMTPGRDPVRTEIDGRTVRSYIVRMKPSLRAEPEDNFVNATTEVNAAGSDSGEPLTLDLLGVVVQSSGGMASAAIAVVADIRTRVGAPRLRWVLRISADMPGSVAVGLGSVVTLTSVYAVGIDPTTDADSTPCRVVGIKRDIEEGVIELELRPFPGVSGGWAQSARVDSITNVTTLVIEAADFSADDGSHFIAGDKVVRFSPGAWSARVPLVIGSVVGSTIIFTGVHGASVGDLLRCDDYSTAVARQKPQAFLSTDGAIGTADGRIIA